MPELVRRIVDHYRLSGDFRQEQLFADWSSLVGDKVGARTRPDTIIDRVLIVEVASSAWLHELRLIRPKIVSDLLDYARAREPVTSAVDVVDLIDEVQTVLPAPPEVVVERHDAPATPTAQVDRDQLRQVLLNLVSNAYEAMPEGGTVTITTEATANGLRISVADTGMGMDTETRRQLFEPFFTRKTKGIGLGLSVTKRIVEAHRGVIAVQSELGEGTTFTVDLPAFGTPPGHAEAGEA